MNPGKDTLVFVQNGEPISLFCADETDGESLAACQQVVEPLLGYDLEGNINPQAGDRVHAQRGRAPCGSAPSARESPSTTEAISTRVT